MPRLNGRRGAFLLLFAAVHVLVGLSYTVAATPNTERTHALLVAVGIPLQALGAVWYVSALVALVAAFVHPPGRDGFGFQALMALESFGALVYATAWVLGDSPRGWVGAVLFGALSAATYVVSGMVSATALTVDES